jgi:hypothetical protein
MTDYQHGEAFRLMHYACKCGHAEIIWNSRDGVTPFGLGCPSCGGASLMHVNWREDVLAPDHKPYTGQRFFRDGTPEEALAIIERRIKRFIEGGHSVPMATQQHLKHDALHTEGEWLKGWPMIERTP